MEWVAFAIVISTCLYLIDKNQKWKAFGKTMLVLAVLAGLGIAYIEHEDAESAKAYKVKWDK